MEKISSILFYVLPAGSTQEETFTWQDLQERVEAGNLSLESLVFNPEAKEWERIGDMDEFRSLKEQHATEDPEETAGTADDESGSELQEEYRQLLSLLKQSPNSVELQTQAGRAAMALGENKEARNHYQKALDLKPFYPRLVQEIRRSFSPAECRKFSFLDRKPPCWQDFPAIFTFPLRSGWKRFAGITACLTALLYIPWGFFWLSLGGLLLVVHVARETGAGVEEPFALDLWASGPALHLARSFAAALAVWAEIVFPFILIAGVSLLLGRESIFSVPAYIKGSPPMVVFIFTLGLGYFPAVLVMAATSDNQISELLNPRKVFTVITFMEMEYLATVTLVTGMCMAWLLCISVFAPIPFAGRILISASGLFLLSAGGCVLGRLIERYGHVFTSSPRSHSAEIE